MNRSLALVTTIALTACNESRSLKPPPPPAVRPPPETLIPRPRVKIAAGRVLGRLPWCGKIPWNREREDIYQHVSAFSIDFAPVSCVDWQQCVAAHACDPAIDYCSAGAASVGHTQAADYCARHGGKLPTWGQWHRAVRADRRDDSPNWDSECFSRGYHACTFISTEGVLFVSDGFNEVEWIRDDVCLAGQPRTPTAVNLVANSLGVPNLSPRLKYGEFRCVYE